jgi:hypothetical protein
MQNIKHVRELNRTIVKMKVTSKNAFGTCKGARKTECTPNSKQPRILISTVHNECNNIYHQVPCWGK